MGHDLNSQSKRSDELADADPLSNEKPWVSIREIRPKSICEIALPVRFETTGKQTLPAIRILMFPRSKLFRFWKVLESDDVFFVLPSPLDQGIKLENNSQNRFDHADQDTLDLIRDPRLMHLKDQKLFLKTGKPYLRTSDAVDLYDERTLDWTKLSLLSEAKKGEQFSFWLRRLDQESRAHSYWLKVETPFWKGETATNRAILSQLKNRFSDWMQSHV